MIIVCLLKLIHSLNPVILSSLPDASNQMSYILTLGLTLLALASGVRLVPATRWISFREKINARVVVSLIGWCDSVFCRGDI